MDESIVWENKLSNASLIDDLTAGELDNHYWPQLEQQLLAQELHDSLAQSLAFVKMVSMASGPKSLSSLDS